MMNIYNVDSNSSDPHNETFDLANTINRLKSIFQNVEPTGYDMYEDDDDTESDEDDVDKTCRINEEHEEQTVCSKKVCIEQEDTQSQDNWEHKNTQEMTEEENSENYDSTSDSEYEFKPDINEYHKKHANQFVDDPCFNRPGEELLSMYEKYEKKPPISYFIHNSQMINIDTGIGFLNSEDSSASSQIPDVEKNWMTEELDRLKKENDDYRMQLDTCKNQMDDYKNTIDEMIQQNSQIKKELHNKCDLIKELQMNSNNTANQSSDAVQKLRAENQQMYQKFVEEQSKNNELEKQIQKLHKYEAIFKRIELVQINKKLYQVINRIGKGGFSEVFCCFSFEDKKTYALKKSDLNNLDEDNRKLVFRETDTLKGLQNTDKVVKFIDHEYLAKKKIYYVVMEMGSCDLSHIFKKEINAHHCVREPMRVFYWTKMLQAVKAIHELGVVHSDLKPANFILVNDDVKLIDFNISNVTGDRTSVTVQNECGTIEYMSPDMFLKDERTDGRVNKKLDIWSMGIILYYMVYGKLPLAHIKTFPKKMFAICDATKKEFSFPPVDNPFVLDVIQKCLIHDPKERYSVDQLLSHSYITSKPIH